MNIIYGVPQGSTLGPLLFNIYLSDLFLFLEEINIASYADDTTTYIYNNNLDLVIVKLEEDSSLLIKWINNNHMKGNPDKFQILLTGNDETLSVNFGDYKILNRGSEKLLVIFIFQLGCLIMNIILNV